MNKTPTTESSLVGMTPLFNQRYNQRVKERESDGGSGAIRSRKWTFCPMIIYILLCNFLATNSRRHFSRRGRNVTYTDLVGEAKGEGIKIKERTESTSRAPSNSASNKKSRGLLHVSTRLSLDDNDCQRCAKSRRSNARRTRALLSSTAV